MNVQAHIRGLGYHVPSNILSNKDLEAMVDTSDDWITSRTGIKQRHLCSNNEACSDIALQAAHKAISNAGLEIRDINRILVATFTPDSYIPSAACILQHKLGLKGCMSLDVSAACSGFLYSLETARGLACLHPEDNILIVASEVLSSRTDYEDRATCVLFGDGAGAVVLSGSTPGKALVEDVLLRADGSLGDLLTVKGGGSGFPVRPRETVKDNFFVQMQGQEVFRHAVRSMTEVTKALMHKHQLTEKDIDLFIPHQANIRIIDSLQKKLNFPREKIFVNLEKYGNTSAASVPIALSEAYEQGLIPPGSRVLSCSFGGGFTWGAGLMQF